MTILNRRTILVRSATALAFVITAQSAAQAAGPKVEETDPMAVSLGYKDDTTKVDEKKFPKHAATQKCNNCQLYQGAATDALGGCPLFAGKQVAGNGWCSAWTKKA